MALWARSGSAKVASHSSGPRLLTTSIEPEVIDEEQVDGEELPQLGLVALGEAGVLEGLEHAVRPHGEDRVAAPAGDVTEGVGEKGLAHPDRTDDGDVVMALQEAEGRELVEEGVIE